MEWKGDRWLAGCVPDVGEGNEIERAPDCVVNSFAGPDLPLAETRGDGAHGRQDQDVITLCPPRARSPRHVVTPVGVLNVVRSGMGPTLFDQGPGEWREVIGS